MSSMCCYGLQLVSRRAIVAARLPILRSSRHEPDPEGGSLCAHEGL